MILTFLTKYYPYIAGALLLIAAVAWIWLRGYHACEAHAATAIIKEEAAHDRIEQKVNSVPDSRLDRALGRWVLKQK